MKLLYKDPEKYRGLPSMSIRAISVMDLYLIPSMEVFEWGSGGSTIFFRRRARVVTIEHDQEWFNTVDGAIEYWKLRPKGLMWVVEPVDEPNPEYATAKEGFAGWSFEKYAKAIDEYPDEHFDLISVDGRSRSACMRHAYPKLKQGGLLVLDDANRPQYREARDELNKLDVPYADYPGRIPYLSDALSVNTCIWIKRLEEEEQEDDTAKS